MSSNINDVVERVAKALARHAGQDPDAVSHREGEHIWTYYVSTAEAALDAASGHLSGDGPLCDTHGTPFISPGICPFCDHAARSERPAVDVRELVERYRRFVEAPEGSGASLDYADAKAVLAALEHLTSIRGATE